MPERPILFSAPMVRAILADKKTMTRRVMTPQPERNDRGGWSWGQGHRRVGLTGSERPHPEWLAGSPYGEPGGALWVRESWGPCDDLAYGVSREDPTCIRYAADGAAWIHEEGNHQPLDTTDWPDGPDGGHAEDGRWQRGRWRPSIHMPRWASRITLKVTSIAVQRLQDITPADILAEGFGHDLANRMAEDGEAVEAIDAALLDAWETGWDGINGHRAAWASNPWVWVVGFKWVRP